MLMGEEILLESLWGLLHFWDKTRNDPDPFIMVNLYRLLKDAHASGDVACQSSIILKVEPHFRNG